MKRWKGRLHRPGLDDSSVGVGPASTLESEVLQRLSDIEARLRDTQAMAARAYESSFDWSRLLSELRRAPEYEAAFTGDPLVSVRITTFNLADTLCERALASLRRQTYEHWEALVVGDACTDDTAEKIDAIGDPRIRFWNLPFRGPYPDDARSRWLIAGTAPANRALRSGRGAWLASLDHDDEWDDDHLEILLRAAQRERAEVAYGRIRILHEDGQADEEMGRWPPEMGHFGFLAALCHGALRGFEFDINARFAGEPGDWNRARRLWDAGVRFHYVDRALATNFFVRRVTNASTELPMIEELREWARELETARDWWRQKAESRGVHRALGRLLGRRASRL